MPMMLEGKVVAVGRAREWKDKAGVSHETITVTVSDGEDLFPVQYDGGARVPVVDTEARILCLPPVNFVGGRPVAQELRAKPEDKRERN